MTTKHKFIFTKIVEPFPVLWSHTNSKGKRPGECEGPFYAANSEHTTAIFSDKALQAAEFSAEYLRFYGWTVYVEVK